MPHDSVTCDYVFTEEEYTTTKVLGRRLLPVYKGLLIALVALAFLGLGLKDLYWGLQAKHRDFATYFSPVPGFLLVLFFAYRFIPLRTFCKPWDFKKSHLYNRNLMLSLSTEGLSSDETDGTACIKWTGLARAWESREGFAIYIRDTGVNFVWFPKWAFIEEGDVDRCRNLIREHIADFQTFSY